MLFLNAFIQFCFPSLPIFVDGLRSIMFSTMHDLRHFLMFLIFCLDLLLASCMHSIAWVLFSIQDPTGMYCSCIRFCHFSAFRRFCCRVAAFSGFIQFCRSLLSFEILVHHAHQPRRQRSSVFIILDVCEIWHGFVVTFSAYAAVQYFIDFHASAV